MKLIIKPVSALEKVFLDEEPAGMPDSGGPEGFGNETISFQAAYCLREGRGPLAVTPRIRSPLAGCIRLRRVGHVPVRFACFEDSGDNYLRKAPGLYPDLLRDIAPHRLHARRDQWDTLWIDVEPEGSAEPGTYPVEIALLEEDTGEVLGEATVRVTILPGALPPQTLIHTQWMHCDCLAHYYHVPVFSEDFWRITENFMRLAVKRGVNMTLLPIHTPPLDTRVGGERLTVQLVDVYREGGAYSFGFGRLRRWVAMAERCGMAYFEAAHLFTQWGAAAAPKIMGTADGEYRRLFGWDTPACSEEYRRFLGAYLPALTAELKALGIDGRCFFHISDEPDESRLDSYMKAKALVSPYLKDYPIMDALSDFGLYQSGAVSRPIPALDRMEPFLKAGIPGLWTYTCVGQHRDVSNTFIAMPSSRSRILGIQLYKYGIAGFLRWGYNFYGSRLSDCQVDPYAVTDGDGFTPAGDCFLVYPGEGGVPEDSIRMMLLSRAMQDLRALQYMEALCGREETLRLIDEGLDEPLTLTRYPREGRYITDLRRRVNRAIVKAAR